MKTNIPAYLPDLPPELQQKIEQKRLEYNFADFPLVLYNPKTRAFYSSRTVFDNIRNGHARIFTYEIKLTSIFTLKCHFHSNNKKFTYRSDKFPGDVQVQYKRMIDLAKRNAPLCYSIQLYDNRRAAPDDLLINWKNNDIVFSHEYLPFSVPELSNAQKDQVINYYNSIKHKIYETIPPKIQV